MSFKKSLVELVELHSQNAKFEYGKTCYVPEAFSYTQPTVLIHAQIILIFKSPGIMTELTKLI